MMSEEMVVVGKFSSQIQAEIARGKLETAGINALILKDDAGGMLPVLQPITGVRLVVAQGEAERAREILDS